MKKCFIIFVICFSVITTKVYSQIFPASLVGRWKFDNTADLLHATLGNDLVLTGTHTAVSGPVAGDTAIAIGVGSYYTCTHGIPANGGGTLVNEYSIMYDFMIPASSLWYCFYQTNITNSNDGEVFISPSGTIGVGATGYAGVTIQPNTWHRLLVSVDLGNSFKYYLDGHLILDGTSQAVDGRFSLDNSSVLFFADDNGEDNLIDVAQIAIFNAALDSAEAFQLGGLSTFNINPYLQTPTATSIYVSWSSHESSTTIVQYGTTPALGNSTNGTYEDISTNRWHTVKLTGLTPATRYYYRCISGIDTSATYPFHTAANPGTPGEHIRFAIIGDSQTNISMATTVADSMLSTFRTLYGMNWYDSITLIMHSGDIMGNGNDLPSYTSEYFTPFAKLSCSVPFMISIGNHVMESSYYYSFVKYEELSDFAIPNPLNEKYYSFYLGDCQFIALNTNGNYNNSTQTNWLTSKLSNSDTNSLCDFVFSFSHQPGHSEIWPDGNTAYVWNDVYGELKKFPKEVMHSMGHSHCYERGVLRTSHAMDWDFRTTISGGAGGDLDRWGAYTNQTDYPEVQRSLDYYNWVLVDVNMTEKKCETKMYSLGNPDKPMNNVIADQWHRYINQAAPNKPIAISPGTTGSIIPMLTASLFSGLDSLMSSQFQLAGKYEGWNNSIIDTLRDKEDTYQVTGAPNYYPINVNAGIDLHEFQVPAGLLVLDSTYKWRIRYRDDNVRWSAWSDSMEFKVLPVQVVDISDGDYFTLMPNPTSGKLNVQSLKFKVQSLEIYNMQGQQMLSVQFQNQNTMQFDLSSLAKGVYIVKIQSENFVVNKKLIVQ